MVRGNDALMKLCNAIALRLVSSTILNHTGANLENEASAAVVAHLRARSRLEAHLRLGKHVLILHDEVMTNAHVVLPVTIVSSFNLCLVDHLLHHHFGAVSRRQVESP